MFTRTGVSHGEQDGERHPHGHPGGLRIVRRMLQAGAVDVVQIDATRCGGVTGFLQAAALCEAFHTPLSTHTGWPISPPCPRP